MQRFLGLVVDSDGTPMSGVTVTVKKAGTGTNAALYSDNIYTTKTNGFTNDSDGTYEFYAPNGRIDLIYTKGGTTFTDANSADIILYDPADESTAASFQCDFLSGYSPVAGTVTYDGYWFLTTGSAGSVTGTTTYRTGWVDIIESGGTAGNIALEGTPGTIALNWVPSTDAITLDIRIEKVGAAVAGTRRCGLASASFSAGEPASGVYIRQVDANNAFLVCRAATSESTQDLGVTLTTMKRIRIMITTASVRAFVDDVAKTAITTNIPATVLGLSAGGGATSSGAGLRVDYLSVYNAVRV
jgi:hypothetical protein